MSTDTFPPTRPADPSGFRRLARDPTLGIAAGVAAGLARHLNVPVVVVRVAFVALLAANGVGALLYVAFWAVLPSVPSPVEQARRANTLQSAGLLALAAGMVLVEVQLGSGAEATVVGFVAMAALGAGIIWHQAEPARRRRGATGRLAENRVLGEHDIDADRRWWLPLPLIGGGILVVVGLFGTIGFLSPIGQTSLRATVTGLLFSLLAVGGLVLAFAPLLYRVFGQLREERVARIREQERAEVAAIVHDQVLHTLALIQRGAHDPAVVARLARSQERTLRQWLYAPTGSPAERFAAALEHVSAEVEDSYAVTVETVVVGDCGTDEHVGAVVAAAREALVNAARHAGVRTVSVYAEVEPDQISVYVRDRGAGFDLATVDDDRHGVRGSIIGRMRRHGGQARIRTTPGDGTEVELTMPRANTTQPQTATAPANDGVA